MDSPTATHRRLFQVVLHVTQYRLAEVFVEASDPSEAKREACLCEIDESRVIDEEIQAGDVFEVEGEQQGGCDE